MKKYLILICLSLFTLNLFSQSSDQAVSEANDQESKNFISFELNNGLTVVLNPDDKANTVYGMVMVKAGGKNDPADATGIAHYLEHMLFKGTDKIGTINWEREKVHMDRIIELYDELGRTTDDIKRKEIQKSINQESIEANNYIVHNELDKTLRLIGSTGLNAFTSEDMTAYFNEFPPTQIEKWLKIYSDRFINPVFRSFQAELEVVYEEYNMYNDMFFSPLLEEFNRNFYKNHQYGQQTIIGSMEHLKNPSLTKMYDFYKNYYVPNNMVLILSGKFNEADVLPLINQYFSIWEPGEVKPFEVKQEKPFNGRELVNVKMSPIKIGILGFRMPEASHEDQLALDVLTMFLSNSNQTGLLDKLSSENKLMFAQSMPLSYKDHGALLVLFAPKLIGQSHENAEKLIMEEIQKIKKGEISEEQIESIKKSLYVDYLLETENHQYMTIKIAQALANEIPLSHILEYPNRVLELTTDDIVRVANKYFTENYLAFFSSMGFPKKAKIDKPGYEALSSVVNQNSEYFEGIKNMKNLELNIEPAQYFSNVKENTLDNNAKLYFVENPYNNVASFTMRFFISNEPNPYLSYAVRALNNAGTSSKSQYIIKEELAKLGLTMSFSHNESNISINLQGLDENIDKGLILVYELLTDAKIDQTTVKTLYEEDKASRKMETSDADNIANLLMEYVLYGEKSHYINRPTLKEIKKLKADELMANLNPIFKETVEYHYIGSNNNLKNVTNTLNNKFASFKAADKQNLYERKRIDSEKNIIYFASKKNTIQSKIFLYQKGPAYNIKQVPTVDVFNDYFGGGFSGLVMKEIREFRSLAYATGAGLRQPSQPNKNYIFVGFVGTQADKSEEAIEVFMNLINNMPQKPEEIDFIKDFMLLSIYSNIPNFRRQSFAYSQNRFMGWDFDPLIFKNEYYKNISSEQITEFWDTHIKEKPTTIMVVADKKRLNPKKLERFSKVETIKTKKLYKK